MRGHEVEEECPLCNDATTASSAVLIDGDGTGLGLLFRGEGGDSEERVEGIHWCVKKLGWLGCLAGFFGLGFVG